MNIPLLSVVIVVYNGGRTIMSAIDSVLEQSYKNIELIIIDGLSTDNTIALINGSIEKIAYFISQKDNGIYDAMNKGIAASKGAWLFFLGADDRLYSRTIIEEIFRADTLTGADLLYGDVEFTSNKRRYGSAKDYRQLIEQNICHQAIFYRRELFEKYGNYNTRYPILGDYEMNLRLFRQPDFRATYMPVSVTLFNDKGTSNSTVDRYFHQDMLKCFLEQDKIPFFSPILQQYHFYYGYITTVKGTFLIGIKHIICSWISGKRKLFYFLLTGKYIVMNLGGKKVKIK